MCARHTNASGLWRCVPLVLILCLCAAPALAQVPQTLIDRLVELDVKTVEGNYLRNSKQIDLQEWSARQHAISTEQRTLGQQFRQFSADEQRQANSTIDGLTRARLAILEPQWQAKADAFRQQREQHNKDVSNAVSADAKKALEPQRRRALLQKRRDRGEITAEEFQAEDKKALDEIMALRNKYVAEGKRYTDDFDSQLARLTENMATEAAAPRPAAPRPAPQARTTPAPQRQTYPPDFQPDIARAAEIVQSQRMGNLGPVGPDGQKTFDVELQRLREKWRARGRTDFDQQTTMLVEFNVAEAAQRKIDEENARAEQQRARRDAVLGFVYGAFELLIGIAVLYGIYRFIRFLAKNAGSRPEAARRVSDVYGTAHYARTQFDVTDDMCVANGIFFGKSSAPERADLSPDVSGAPICSTPEHHTLIVARTRTGKGTRVIVPTLLRYAGSAFVIDPKGENAAVTARLRRDQLQQKVHILNPWNELAAAYTSRGFVRATYNPLDILDRSDPNVVAVAEELSAAMCPPTIGEPKFWQNSAAHLLTAVLLWLVDQPGERKTLARAREIISLTRKELREKFLIPMSVSDAFSGAIREKATPFIDLADDTYTGVMINLSEGTGFLSDPQAKTATETSSFSMEDLVRGKTTVYVVIPTGRKTQMIWLRLLVAAAMHTFRRSELPAESRHRCLFLIDEFAALGRMDDMPGDISTMSGFGVDFALVVQGLHQLKAHYGDDKDTIIGNCAYKWFCNVDDLDSAKYLSEVLGKKTVSTSSSSASSSSGPGGYSSSQSTSQSETGRNLLNPDEILNLGKSVAITIHPHGRPHYLNPVDYWNLPEAFRYLQEKHPSLYWEPPLRFDDNPRITPPAGSGGNGAGNKERAQGGPSPRRQKMTVELAREILGVKAGANSEEIRKAYLNLMTKVHPDVGGSNHFAKELNEAKDVLLAG